MRPVICLIGYLVSCFAQADGLIPTKEDVVAYFDTLTPYQISRIKTYQLPKPLGQYVTEVVHDEGIFHVTIEGAICGTSEHELKYSCEGKCQFELEPVYTCTTH